MSRGHILIVDDEPLECQSLYELLRSGGYEVEAANSGQEAINKLDLNSFDIVLTDIRMPDVTGFDILYKVTEKDPQTAVILITGYGEVEDAVQAIKSGAFDYIKKPLSDETIKMAVHRALEQQMLKREISSLRKQLGMRLGFGNLIGRDHKMQKIYNLIETVADTEATILITGESGTGKSLMARTIHYNSHRRDKRLIEVSCGVLAENLLESELFGHVKGAFTGADYEKEGKFELASGGTIFLDEIATASPALQVKLLRVLQEGEFEKVGGTTTISTDARVIIATNRDLEEEVRLGNFRQDLYYRINVVRIEIPPLRMRGSDIKLLAEHFLRIYAEQNGKNITSISDEAMEVMLKYPWKGNVRELENAIEHAVILTKNEHIKIDDLPQKIVENITHDLTPHDAGTLKKFLERPEKICIEKALMRNKGNRQKTAQELGINRTTLFKKMQKYGLITRFARRSNERRKR